MDLFCVAPSHIPKTFYRVVHRNQHTAYYPNIGFVASGHRLPLLVSSVDPNATFYFLQSIRDHRDQVDRPTLYISTFDDLKEAQAWAVAAQDFHREEAYVVRIEYGAINQQMPFYHVADIQKKTGKILGLGGRVDSEWLIHRHIPLGTIKEVMKTSDFRKCTLLFAIFFCFICCFAGSANSTIVLDFPRPPKSSHIGVEHHTPPLPGPNSIAATLHRRQLPVANDRKLLCGCYEIICLCGANWKDSEIIALEWEQSCACGKEDCSCTAEDDEDPE